MHYYPYEYWNTIYFKRNVISFNLNILHTQFMLFVIRGLLETFCEYSHCLHAIMYCDLGAFVIQPMAQITCLRVVTLCF